MVTKQSIGEELGSSEPQTSIFDSVINEEGTAGDLYTVANC